jgi:hypothetical protein
MKIIYTIFLVLLSFISSLTSYSQTTPSDDCSSPTIVSDLDGICETFSYTGASANNGNWAPICFSDNGGNPADLVYFSFTAQGPNVDVSISGLDDAAISVISLIGTDLCLNSDVAQINCSAPNNSTSASTSTTNNPLVVGDEYYIVVDFDETGTFDLCVDNPVDNSPLTCDIAQPFCTADGDVVYDAGVDNGVADPANDYGCLTTQPNPTWFFLEIEDPGSLDLSFTSSPAEDIDYVSWGPFTDQADACANLTTANITDCSYLTATSESLSLTGTQAGEVYMVMITNYSNNPTEITFSQTTGTATTNCAIVLPVTLSSFEVINVDNSNELSWTTASETNNDYFIVEYSIDGQNWSQIQKVQGAGNSNSENTYLTYHRDFEKGINYYRLKQVDYDGAVNTHKIISINNKDGRVLLKKVNSMGQEVNEDYKGMVIEYYEDGSTRKVMQ